MPTHLIFEKYLSCTKLEQTILSLYKLVRNMSN